MSFFDIISVGGIRRSRRVVLADLRSRARLAEQPVPGFPACSAALLDIDAAASLEREWRQLADAALEPNFCYEPDFAIAAARHLRDTRNVRFVMIWHRGGAALEGGADERLIGCFPVMASRADIGAPLLRGWLNPQIMNGTPLVDRAFAREALGAFLTFAGAQGGSPVGVLFPRLPLEGPFRRLLDETLEAASRPIALFGAGERAMLRLTGDPARGLSAKKKKELRRQYRRLGELGVLTTESASGLQIRDPIEHFMALEAAGWKGKAGTAFVQDPGRAAFLRAAARALAASGRISVESILLDGKPIACGLLAWSGRQGYFWKITYDEAYAAYSPGVQLTLALAERAQALGFLDAIDSCAISDHPMIDHVWRDRLAVADVMVPLSTRSALRFSLAKAREGAKRDLRARVKSTLYKLQGRTVS
jgi:CelD/BcsL family acetyltransferase involved in cellulose biosynthesis